MGREGFEPPKAKPADLQSAAFNHFATCPRAQAVKDRQKIITRARFALRSLTGESCAVRKKRAGLGAILLAAAMCIGWGASSALPAAALTTSITNYHFDLAHTG